MRVFLLIAALSIAFYMPFKESTLLTKGATFDSFVMRPNFILKRIKKASAELEIAAPIEKVWSMLTSVKDYNTWNPFVYNVETEKDIPISGTNMLFSVRFENGKETQSKEFVTQFEPPANFNGEKAVWEYRFAGFIHQIGMIRAVRVQTLTKVDNNLTTYASTEIFTGWGKSFVPLESVQKGFEAQAAALKVKCEA